MKIFFITVGQPKLSFVKDGLNEYLKRISRFVSFHFSSIKENNNVDKNILKLSEGKQLILLDENGSLFSTRELSSFLEKQQEKSKDLCFVVAGADGHSDFLKEKADYLWSLSPLTFPHDIATLLACETLYRSFSVLNRHPYHRD